jgi:hypothetical protein
MVKYVMVATVNIQSDDFNLTDRNPGSGASLLAATLYQEHPDINLLPTSVTLAPKWPRI